MREYVSDAIVLGIEPSREYDRAVTLFTKELGRIRARVTGGAKILSKFAPHLDPMNRVQVRLAHKKGFTLTDALTVNRFAAMKHDANVFGAALRMLTLIGALAPEAEPDARVWHELVRALECGKPDIQTIASHFGYDLDRAECERCGARPAPYFAFATHALLCANCSVRIPENALLLLSEA